jgi:hypothetical protein
MYTSQTVWTSWEGGMGPLTGVATAAIVERVKFLHQQAAEVLSAWRARRGPGPPRHGPGARGDADSGGALTGVGLT